MSNELTIEQLQAMRDNHVLEPTKIEMAINQLIAAMQREIKLRESLINAHSWITLDESVEPFDGSISDLEKMIKESLSSK